MVYRVSVSTGTGGRFGTLDFGTRNGVDNTPVSTSFVADGALSIACTPGVALSMSIDGGQNYSSVRRMTRSGGTELLVTGFTAAALWRRTAKLGLTRLYRLPIPTAITSRCLFFGVALLTGFSLPGTYSDHTHRDSCHDRKRKNIDEAIFQVIRPGGSVGGNGLAAGQARAAIVSVAD